MALNAIFYFDDKISEKYKYARSLFLFAFSNNITVIFLSTIIGFVFWIIFVKLTNCTNDIKEVFSNEERKIKKNKKYVMNRERKIEIINEINNIFKKYQIKVIVFVVIEMILMMFFWYYVTVFCQIYSSTQSSWLWNSFLSILSGIFLDFILAMGFAKFYRIGVESKIIQIYRIAIFIYSFS